MTADFFPRTLRLAALVDEDGAHITTANPLPVSAAIAANQSVKVEGGAADLKVSLDGEAVATVAVPGTLTATIAESESLSDEIDLAGASLLTLHMPAAFTGTKITFLTSPTLGGTYQTLRNAYGIEIEVAVAPGEARSLGAFAADLASVQFIKLRSGTAASPTTEAAERVIPISTK